MIILKDRNPKFSLYNIGYLILKRLKEKGSATIEFLYSHVSNEIQEDIHIDFIYYSLDWLYLLSAIELKDNEVVLCSSKN